MEVLVLSRSTSLERHLTRALGTHVRARYLRSVDEVDTTDPATILLVHSPSFPGALPRVLGAQGIRSSSPVAIAADRPRLEEMLALSEYGIQAYFNSYMADVHYLHMLRLLSAGQTWFTPGLLAHALSLARRALSSTADEGLVSCLSRREREIALDVALGLSNKRIASARNIAERTVKSHLTKIFKKLQVPDRVALAIKLSGQIGADGAASEVEPETLPLRRAHS